MNKIFTLLLLGFTLIGISQPNVFLRFEHMMDGNDLQFNQEYTEPNQGYAFNITRLQYYISEIVITHDGGQTSEVEDTWLLVNADEQIDYALGKQSIASVEGISFYIGVDPGHNHLDPTTYPAGHSLAPQNPSMHWGWAAGYRFVCLEGKTGFNLLFTYEIHALGDANYFQTNIPTTAIWEDGNLVIILNADYIGMYKNIDVSGGLIEHGETGAAETLLQNFSSEVYSQILFTGIQQEPSNDLFLMYPNPTHDDYINISLISFSSEIYDLAIVDMTGKVVISRQISNTSNLSIDGLKNGVYFVQLWTDNKLSQSEKLIIVR